MNKQIVIMRGVAKSVAPALAKILIKKDLATLDGQEPKEKTKKAKTKK